MEISLRQEMINEAYTKLAAELPRKFELSHSSLAFKLSNGSKSERFIGEMFKSKFPYKNRRRYFYLESLLREDFKYATRRGHVFGQTYRAEHLLLELISFTQVRVHLPLFFTKGKDTYITFESNPLRCDTGTDGMKLIINNDTSITGWELEVGLFYEIFAFKASEHRKICSTLTLQGLNK